VRASGWRRLAAWGVDCAAALLWAGVLAAVVWPQRNRFLLARLAEHPVLENLVGFAALVLPVTLALAWAEHRWGRTPGKRVAGVRVVARSRGGAFSPRRALARNAVKVALPWAVGHAAVFVLAGGAAAPGPGGILLLALSYLLPLVTLVGIFARGRRTPHDVVARTEVVLAR
jgi:uncharacterized RDD family membrane protein YckC